MATKAPTIQVTVPKIDTNSLHDPVVEFVPEPSPDGDMVPELPGGLHRMVVPSPRGGFYANSVDMDWASKQLEGALQRRPDRTQLIERNILMPAPLPQTPKKDQLDTQFDVLINKGEKANHLVLKDKIDGITPRSGNSPRTPRRDRAYDALQSPRRVKQ